MLSEGRGVARHCAVWGSPIGHSQSPALHEELTGKVKEAQTKAQVMVKITAMTERYRTRPDTATANALIDAYVSCATARNASAAQRYQRRRSAR